MTDLTSFDLRLISALKKDGRASVTTLAGLLGASRARVQSRMERLVETGVIQRFTVALDTEQERGLVRAVVLIEIQGAMAPAIIRSLRQLPEMVSLHTTNGVWDLVAQIETSGLPEFDRVLRIIREINGILNSETCILLNRA